MFFVDGKLFLLTVNNRINSIFFINGKELSLDAFHFNV